MVAEAPLPLGPVLHQDVEVPLLFLIAILAFSAPSCRSRNSPTNLVRVAAASDLTTAFEELAQDFEAQAGHKVSLSFGSSGLLAKQLRQGAPFDVFAAANESFVDEAVAAGVCLKKTKALYARGRLAIWSRAGQIQPPPNIEALADARFTRIAIAHPEHAPYGQAAAQALQKAGIWDAVSPRLVYGENVRQTLQLAETGNVDAAIVALSLVAADRTNPWLLVDESMHRALNQAIVVCTGGSNQAAGQAFAQFVTADDGRAVMRRHGFAIPREGAP